MKLLSVLLSIWLCFALSVSAMQIPEGGEFSFDGKMPQMAEGGEFPFSGERPQMPEGGMVPPEASMPQEATQEEVSEIEEPKATQKPDSDENSSEYHRETKFPGRGEGGFQPPAGGGFSFDGGNFRGQNPENTAGQDGFWGIWTRYSDIIISLGVLMVSFVFVGLYRRRHY